MIFFKGLSLAYNKLTFRVKQLPISEKEGPGLDWNEFNKLCEKLIKRELTGHAARDEIINLKINHQKMSGIFLQKEDFKKI